MNFTGRTNGFLMTLLFLIFTFETAVVRSSALVRVFGSKAGLTPVQEGSNSEKYTQKQGKPVQVKSTSSQRTPHYKKREISSLHLCLQRKEKAKKFWCTHNFPPFDLLETDCPTSPLIFIGDSIIGQFSDWFDCLCPTAAKKSTTVLARGPKTPLASALAKISNRLEGNEVIILNCGLWFHPTTASLYKEQLAKLREAITKILRLHHGVRFVWLSSVAQHFCAKGGIYPDANIRNMLGRLRPKWLSMQCCKVQEFNTFRQDIAYESLIMPLNGTLQVFDAFHMTSKWHLHHRGNGDCSHYCSNPRGAMHQLTHNLVHSLM